MASKSAVTLALRSDNRGALRDFEACEARNLSIEIRRNLTRDRIFRLGLLSLRPSREKPDSVTPSEKVDKPRQTHEFRNSTRFFSQIHISIINSSGSTEKYMKRIWTDPFHHEGQTELIGGVD
jgi:hypothetical protein